MSQWYPYGLQSFAAGDLDWDAHTFRVAFFPSTYEFDEAHQHLSDVTAVVAAVATSPALTTKTNVGGNLDADDLVLPSVTGPTMTRAVLYRDTGVAGTSTLLVFWDGFTLTPNGEDVQVRFHANGLATL